MIAHAVLWLFLHCSLGVQWSCYSVKKQEILAGSLSSMAAESHGHHGNQGIY